MGYSDYCTLILLQVLLQPIDRFGIEVVGRLIEQQYIGLLQQQTTQRHTAAFTSRKVCYILIGRRTTECVHSTLQYTIQLPAVHMVNLLVEFALTLDKTIHLVIVHRLAEFHIDILVLFEQRYGCSTTLLDNLLYGLVVVEQRLLLQVAYGVTR